MTLSPISFNDNKSVYNAIKIKVDSPQTNIPEGHKNSDDNAEKKRASCSPAPMTQRPPVNPNDVKMLYENLKINVKIQNTITTTPNTIL